jgi:hypothetical protein
VDACGWEEADRIIRSCTFLKEKYLAAGEFEKLKAKLVVGGDQQDKMTCMMYDDLSASLGGADETGPGHE